MIPSATFRACAATAFAILMLAAIQRAHAQHPATDAKHRIVGVWQLVSEIHTNKQGISAPNAGFGSDFHGVMIFTASGDYSSLSARPNMPRYPSGQLLTGGAAVEIPAESSVAAHPGISSFGDYSVSADGKMLTVRIKGSTWASWVGVEQKRTLTLIGDELKYTVPAWHVGGTTEFIYKRMK